MNKDNLTLLWLDVETTGLDVNSLSLLEIGLELTGPALDPLTEPFHTAIAWKGEPDDFIRSMHTPNGLLAECAASDCPTLAEARDMAGSWLDRHDPLHEALVAGASVSSDRRFLEAGMPHLLDGYYHGSFDVSALDDAMRMWRPDVWAARPERTTNHRVMACLGDSIALADHYRKALS